MSARKRRKGPPHAEGGGRGQAAAAQPILAWERNGLSVERVDALRQKARRVFDEALTPRLEALQGKEQVGEAELEGVVKASVHEVGRWLLERRHI